MTVSNPSAALRTTQAFYWILGSIFGSGFLLGCYIIFFMSNPIYEPAVIMGCLLLSSMSILITSKIVIHGDVVHSRDIFNVKDIPISRIIRAEFQMGFVPLSYKPFQRILIYVRDADGGKEILLNASLFDPVKAKHWVKNLNERIHA